MEFAYTVEQWFERDNLWYPAYRQGKGDLFNTLGGCKSYITRENYRERWETKPLNKFRIKTYRLELESQEEIV
jgi:hypothetical protein